MKLSAKLLIKKLGLKSHPEGGYYRESYRAKGKIQPAHGKPFPRGRNFSTSIYFLLLQGMVSRLHRIQSDEVWHFYTGGPLTIVEISSKGKIRKTILGNQIQQKHHFQHVVPAGSWFGAFPNPKTQFSLVGCTVAPGFDFQDFEMGNSLILLKKFSHLKREIQKLTLQPI